MLKKIIQKYRYYKKLIERIENNALELRCENRRFSLEESSLKSTKFGLSGDLGDLGPKLVVSLTTYNKRLYDVYLTIESILTQTHKPDRVILWLDESEFSNKDLPNVLLQQKERGLDIKYCKNLKSYKKIIPMLHEYPEDVIVTIDDDVLYPSFMLEEMWRTHLSFPDTIVCNRAHKMTFDKRSSLKPYVQWEWCSMDSEESHLLVATGVGGVLYPPGSLNENVTDEKVFLELAPNADDLWLKAMAFKNGTKYKKVMTDRVFVNYFFENTDVQDIGLFHGNVLNNENDTQFSSIIAHYGLCDAP